MENEELGEPESLENLLKELIESAAETHQLLDGVQSNLTEAKVQNRRHQSKLIQLQSRMKGLSGNRRPNVPIELHSGPDILALGQSPNNTMHYLSELAVRLHTTTMSSPSKQLHKVASPSLPLPSKAKYIGSEMPPINNYPVADCLLKITQPEEVNISKLNGLLQVDNLISAAQVPPLVQITATTPVDLSKTLRGKLQTNDGQICLLFGDQTSTTVGGPGKANVTLQGIGTNVLLFELQQNIERPWNGFKIKCLLPEGMLISGTHFATNQQPAQLPNNAIINVGLTQVKFFWISPIDSLLEKFAVKSKLGEGKGGSVYLVKSKSTGMTFTAKIPSSRAPMVLQSFKRECANLKKMKGAKGVAQYEDVIMGDGQLYLVMELVAGVTLYDFINVNGPVRLSIAKQWMEELIKILQVLNANNIIHHDIKPQNIMHLPNGQLTLLDFGSSWEGRDCSSKDGTPFYSSYEVLAGKLHDQRSDIASIGAVVFFALTAKSPFHLALTESALLNLMKSSSADWNLLPSSSANTLKFFQGLLHPNPDCRTTLINISNHDWFSEANPFVPTQSSLPIMVSTAISELVILQKDLQSELKLRGNVILSKRLKGLEFLDIDSEYKSTLRFYYPKVNLSRSTSKVVVLSQKTLASIVAQVHSDLCENLMAEVSRYKPLPL